jgi:hypothetical protein
MFWISLYTRATTEIEPGRKFGVSGAVAMTLMEKYLQEGHTLWMDNWYSNPQFHDHVHKNRTKTLVALLEETEKECLN